MQADVSPLGAHVGKYVISHCGQMTIRPIEQNLSKDVRLWNFLSASLAETPSLASFNCQSTSVCKVAALKDLSLG